MMTRRSSSTPATACISGEIVPTPGVTTRGCPHASCGPEPCLSSVPGPAVRGIWSPRTVRAVRRAARKNRARWHDAHPTPGCLRAGHDDAPQCRDDSLVPPMMQTSAGSLSFRTACGSTASVWRHRPTSDLSWRTGSNPHGDERPVLLIVSPSRQAHRSRR